MRFFDFYGSVFIFRVLFATLPQIHTVLWTHSAVISNPIYRLWIPLYRTRLDRAYLPQYAVDHKTAKMTAHFEVDSKCIVCPHRLRPKQAISTLNYLKFPNMIIISSPVPWQAKKLKYVEKSRILKLRFFDILPPWRRYTWRCGLILRSLYALYTAYRSHFTGLDQIARISRNTPLTP